VVFRDLLHAEKWLDALVPSRCHACEDNSKLQLFCEICASTIVAAPQNLGNPISAAFQYSGAVQKVIRQAKFGPDENKAHALIRHWRSHFKSDSLPLGVDIRDIDGVCFVPLHWRRRILRGFDLPAIFAGGLAKAIDVPVLDLLVSQRFDKPLSLLASATSREALTRDRYKIRRTLKPRNLVLVDDVTTSGATLGSAAKTLTLAGHRVHCYALAKTPMRLH
jgi:predicted amidophosphoribosyltransferase